MIGNDEVRSVVTYADGVAAAQRALHLLHVGEAREGGRDRFDAGTDRVLNSMWASTFGTHGKVATKTYVTGSRSAVRGANLTILLYDAQTGELIAVLAGDHIGAVRTAGASILMAEKFGYTAPRSLTVVGTGYQATHHVLAFMERFDTIDRVRVAARSPESQDRMRSALLAEGLAEDRIPEWTPDLPAAIAGADVVVTATGAREPVVLGEWLTDGTYIACVGSNSAKRREIDAAALQRAHVVVVDDCDVAARESGDLIRNHWPIAMTVSASGIVGEVGMTRGSRDMATRYGATSGRGIHLFESQGLALYDLILAEMVLSRLGPSDRPSRCGILDS